MGLTKAQLRRYQTKRVDSIILLENLPQLVLQTLFLLKIEQFSIIVTVISAITEKKVLNDSGYAIVQFEVTGISLAKKAYQCRNQVNKIRNQIAVHLALDSKQLIEILKPSMISNGLAITMHIHLNHIQSRDSNHKKLLNELQQSGQLAEIFKNEWNPLRKGHVLMEK